MSPKKFVENYKNKKKPFMENWGQLNLVVLFDGLTKVIKTIMISLRDDGGNSWKVVWIISL